MRVLHRLTTDYVEEEDRIRVSGLNVGWMYTPAEDAIQRWEGQPENWLEIAPSLAAAADGHQWFDPLVLRQQLGLFTQLYLDHLALEETLAYPQARALINPRERELATAEMARRREQRAARMESKLPGKGG